MRFGRRLVGPAIAWLLPLAFGWAFPGSARAADARACEIENVRIGFDDRFKIGSWTPVRIQVRSIGAEPFEGYVEVVAADDDGAPTHSLWPIRVTAGGGARVTAYVRTGSRSADLRFRFVTSDGKTISETNLESVRQGVAAPLSLLPDDLLLLSLGRAQGLDEIPKLPGITATRGGGSREVAVGRIGGTDADALPGRAIGYDGVETVVLDTNDKELLSALSTRGEALIQWVAQGGHLVVSVGSNWQAARDSSIGGILPVKIQPPVRVTDLRALESYAAASAQITETNQSAQVTRLEGVDATGSKVLSSTASTPLVVRGSYGFGRVTVVAFDVDAPPFSTWADRKLFWSKALDLKAGDSGIGLNRGAGRLVRSGASDLSTVLRTSLDSFPGVRMVPFGWVAFLIFVYIVLIGPVDYFLLKKVFKRMEWTWITFPLIVIGVSVAAAYAAYEIKGTELRLNQIDVVDLDQTTHWIRGTTFLNIFSPANQDYEAAVVPLTLGAGSTPLPNTDVRMSWMGAADDGLRGMNGFSRGVRFAQEGFAYAPPGSLAKVESLRVPIWSTKALSAEWFGKQAGDAIESDLQQVGPDRLAGTITNRLDVPLKETIVAFGTQVYFNFPEIAPGATVRVELQQDRQLSGYLNDLRPSYLSTRDTGQEVRISRSGLMRGMMFSGSENPNTDALSNQAFKDLDLTGLLRLDRPMLVAQIDKPGTEVAIGPGGKTPKVGRTTLIRVVLPLDRGQAEKAGAIPR